MAEKKSYDDMTKDEIIAAEKRKLAGIYSRLETKTKKSVSSLVDNAAFMAASLYELQRDINTEGYTEEYHNGANQSGIKRSAKIDIYIQLEKNYASVIKQLTDLLPKEDKIKEKKDDGFDGFVNSREDT